ncbi:acyl-CoA dehydrogenase [Frigoribacterium sp. CFBP9039]|uniref:acyl-CoA dehydrogenase n=1 Tax=Frigoribacterium sp. CFBP9029 TaxID=3096541 RepID=UPI002A6B7B71|nr:acyl-CoA dehydrogenase [Frigoribacterium sp. CFBP9039]MDY0947234.1 acyl-CoA dehydrogenase [Frigoribacterium sp. CFBP9039]
MQLTGPSEPGSLTRLVADDLPSDVEGSLRLGIALTSRGGAAPVPGAGRTADLWRALATLAAHDLGAARAVEPHLDAFAILQQVDAAGGADATDPTRASDATGTPDATDAPGATRASSAATRSWGVFAAELPGTRLEAQQVGDGWSLSGEKGWCSLAGVLDSALVTARVGDERRLFSVDLRQGGVEVVDGAWHARGLVEIPSGPVRFDAVAASPVGAPGWYLERPGFSWGGIAVAACWYGGAVGIARALHRTVVRRDPDPHTAAALGAVDERLSDARRALAEAAELVDAGRATGADGRLLAKRVRATVAHAADDVLTRVGRALGPAPLVADAAHAKRVADLTLYLRQHHADADDASLGRQLRESAVAPW